MAEAWEDVLRGVGPGEWQVYRVALQALLTQTGLKQAHLHQLGEPIIRRGDIPEMEVSPSPASWSKSLSTKHPTRPPWGHVELFVRIAAPRLGQPTDGLVRQWAAAYQKCGGIPGRFTTAAEPHATPTASLDGPPTAGPDTPPPEPVSRAWWRRKQITVACTAAVVVSAAAGFTFVLTGAGQDTNAKSPTPATSPTRMARHSPAPSPGLTASPSAPRSPLNAPPGAQGTLTPNASVPGSNSATSSPPTPPGRSGGNGGGPGDEQPPAFTPPPGDPGSPTAEPPRGVIPGEVAWSRDGEGGAPDSGAVEVWRLPTESGPEWRLGVLPPGHLVGVVCRVSGRVVPVGDAYAGPPGHEGFWYLIKRSPDPDGFVQVAFVDTGTARAPAC